MGLMGIEIALRSLQAQQKALEVVGHNIANANTEGFSRQRAVMETTSPRSSNPGQVGTGVKIQEIQRLRDTLLDSRIRVGNHTLGNLKIKNDILGQIEVIFNEPSETGLNSVMSKFWNAWQDLTNHPEDQTVRVNLKEQGIVLTESLNYLNTRLSELQTYIKKQLTMKVNNLNSFAQQIATLNKQISEVELKGENANDLRDKRDLLLMKLSKMVDFTLSREDNNTVTLVLAGGLLVSGDKSYAVGTKINAGGSVGIKWKDTGIAITVSGGELKGLLDSNNIIVPEYSRYLDDLSGGLVEGINRVNSRGIGLTRITTATSDNAVVDKNVALDIAGLPFTPVNGSFWLTVYDSGGTQVDQKEITFTAGSTTLSSLATDISAMTGLNASVSNGKITINAEGNNTFTFADSTKGGDTSDLLLALGLNTFFSGKKAADISVNTVIQNDVGKIAAAKSLAPGDNSNALDIVNLKDTATHFGGTVDNTAPAWQGGSGSISTLSAGTYVGTDDDVWTFTADSTGGTVGATAGLQVTVTDSGGNTVATLDVGSTYTPGTALSVAEGVSVSFTANTLTANDHFTVDMVKQSSSTTADGYYQSAIGILGVESQNASRLENNQNLLVNHLNYRQEEVSGVSLDEELTNMIKFQHAYQAAAKFISVVDEMLNILINRMGV